jgi:hypothetical protein
MKKQDWWKEEVSPQYKNKVLLSAKLELNKLQKSPRKNFMWAWMLTGVAACLLVISFSFYQHQNSFLRDTDPETAQTLMSNNDTEMFENLDLIENMDVINDLDNNGNEESDI